MVFGTAPVVFPERLRVGTPRLFRELARQGHDLWIYTTLGRGEAYFRVWFLLQGIRLGGVVNCDRHERVIHKPYSGYPRCSKYPPAFGIDLLIDNSDGVVGEGKRYGFDVVHIHPSDEQWVERVLAAVGECYRLVPRNR